MYVQAADTDLQAIIWVVVKDEITYALILRQFLPKANFLLDEDVAVREAIDSGALRLLGEYRETKDPVGLGSYYKPWRHKRRDPD